MRKKDEMGLTRNFNRTGAAAHNQQRERAEEIRYQEKIAAKLREEQDVQEEQKLIEQMNNLYGDKFSDWYDSPAVPSRGYARDRIELIKEWQAQQAYPVLWKTDEIPATYTAVWDDSPDSVTFVKNNRPA